VRELESSLIAIFSADTIIKDWVGKEVDGTPAIDSYHARDNQEERVPYPRITIARFGSIAGGELFQEDDNFSLAMDCPKIAICAWSTIDVDDAYQGYNRCDALLRGPSRVNVATQYFSIYQIKRSMFRDDLFDEKANAFHIHGEYRMWTQLTAVPEPF
jgi:hypothetical protein